MGYDPVGAGAGYWISLSFCFATHTRRPVAVCSTVSSFNLAAERARRESRMVEASTGNRGVFSTLLQRMSNHARDRLSRAAMRKLRRLVSAASSGPGPRRAGSVG
jgi:hypothetical protein